MRSVCSFVLPSVNQGSSQLKETQQIFESWFIINYCLELSKQMHVTTLVFDLVLSTFVTARKGGVLSPWYRTMLRSQMSYGAGIFQNLCAYNPFYTIQISNYKIYNCLS